MRYIGILCELGVVNKNDLLFEKDCEITCPDIIPNSGIYPLWRDYL